MHNLFDWKLVFTQLPKIIPYLPVTLALTFWAMLIGLLLGSLLAIIKIYKIPVLVQIEAVYISIIRGTPIIIQLYLSYFGIPLILNFINTQLGTNYNINGIPNIVFAIVALGLNQAAFDSETIRAAISSVDRGQIEAGEALGMTKFQIFRRIIFPQAILVAIPSLGNSLISLIKGTSLAFVTSVVEITAEGKILAGNSYRYFEAYVSIAIIYWVITFLVERGVKLIEQEFSIPSQGPETIIKQGSK